MNPVSSNGSVSYILCTNTADASPANCIAFGTTVDSHLLHPRLPTGNGTFGVTVYPFKGEWARTVATIGHVFNETSFSHFVYQNGVTFQGTWGTPSKPCSPFP